MREPRIDFFFHEEPRSLENLYNESSKLARHAAYRVFRTAWKFHSILLIRKLKLKEVK